MPRETAEADPSHRPVTVITGTRKGIGRYLAQHYLGKGHHVVGVSRGAADWSLAGYTHFEADVADEEAVTRILRDVRTRFGFVSNLINNAGIASMNHVLLTPAKTVRRIIDTNFVGSFLFARETAKAMSRKKYGRIVNFTTVATPLKLEGEAAYAASKAAVASLTEVMAREFAPFNITVNAIGPTPIETDLIRAVPAEKMSRLIARQAIPRLGTFEDVANVTDFFLAPGSSFVTGQNIFLGGV
jgi:3-oxoacyl-[acyl-carrier protein] reductase